MKIVNDASESVSEVAPGRQDGGGGRGKAVPTGAGAENGGGRGEKTIGGGHVRLLLRVTGSICALSMVGD